MAQPMSIPQAIKVAAQIKTLFLEHDERYEALDVLVAAAKQQENRLYGR